MASPEQSDTIIGANVELTGSLKNQGSIHINGKVTGDITSDATVVVGEQAMVMGPIIARSVIVSGMVHGSIVAHDLLELEPKSSVQGDISAARLNIKTGATFNGTSQMIGAGKMEEGEAGKKRPRLEID